MLELMGVGGGHDGAAFLKDINLRFEAGRISGVIGPNGCGKSTLLRMIARLLVPSAGRILLNGAEVGTIPRGEYAKKVSFLPQARSVPNMSVQALVYHGRHPHLKYPRRYAKSDREAVERALELTGADRYRERNVMSLSGGERQKAYIAMLVAQDADVVLMDEPTTYLDIHYQFEIMELARALAHQGKLLVVVLHDLNMALRYAEHIALMQEGGIVAWDTPETLCKSGLIDDVFQIKTELARLECGSQLLFQPQKEGGSV